MPPANKANDVFKKVKMPEDGNPKPCWEWEGSIGANGTRGYFSYKGVKWLAYRLIFTLVFGPLLKGEVVRHKCDNSLCCNPHHLERGSQSDNENDKYERDRYGFDRDVLDRIVELDADGYNGAKVTHSFIAAKVSIEFQIRVTRPRVSEILSGSRRARQTGK